MKSPKKSSRTITVLAVGDVHDSITMPPDRFMWLGKFANHIKTDYILQIGDIATMDSLNSHERNETARGKLKPFFMEEMAHLDTSLKLFKSQLDRGYAPKMHITLGNHEGARIARFQDDNPEVTGMLSKDFYDVLRRNGWSWTEYGAYYNIGGVLFTHVPFNKMGKPASSLPQIAHHQTCDLVFGHSHVPQVHRQAKNNGHITVINLGCYLPWGHIEPYAKHALTGWWTGVCVLTIRDGHITDHNWVSSKTMEERYGKK